MRMPKLSCTAREQGFAHSMANRHRLNSEGQSCVGLSVAKNNKYFLLRTKRFFELALLCKFNKALPYITTEIIQPVCVYQILFTIALLNSIPPPLKKPQQFLIELGMVCTNLVFTTHFNTSGQTSQYGGSPRIQVNRHEYSEGQLCVGLSVYLFGDRFVTL